MPRMLRTPDRAIDHYVGSITTMDKTRITLYLTAVPTLPISVSQVLADDDYAKDIIRRIMDGSGFSQVNSACMYKAEHDDDLSPLLDVN